MTNFIYHRCSVHEVFTPQNCTNLYNGKYHPILTVNSQSSFSLLDISTLPFTTLQYMKFGDLYSAYFVIVTWIYVAKDLTLPSFFSISFRNIYYFSKRRLVFLMNLIVSSLFRHRNYRQSISVRSNVTRSINKILGH